MAVRIVAAHRGRELGALIAVSTISNAVRLMDNEAERTGVTTQEAIDFLAGLLGRSDLNEQDHHSAVAMTVWLAFRSAVGRLRPENAAADLANAVVLCRIADDGRTADVQLHTRPLGVTIH